MSSCWAGNKSTFTVPRILEIEQLYFLWFSALSASSEIHESPDFFLMKFQTKVEFTYIAAVRLLENFQSFNEMFRIS